MNFTHVQKIKVAAMESGQPLGQWLKQHMPPLSYSRLQKLLRTGQIRVNGKRAKSQTILNEGQEVRLPPSLTHEKKREIKPYIDPQWIEVIQKSILYEDNHLLVIDKPSGLAVQGGTNTKISLDEILKSMPAENASEFRLTHRLDKDTSGILLVAKTAQDAIWITSLFKRQAIQKVYWGLVVGKPAKTQGIIDAPLLKTPHAEGEKILVNKELGLKARTRYLTKATANNLSWIEFYPETGRTHQIRVHATLIGCPLIGDGKYGGKAAHPFSQRTRLCLHARTLILPYPSGEMKTFEAPLPEDMQKIFEKFNFHNALELNS